MLVLTGRHEVPFNSTSTNKDNLNTALVPKTVIEKYINESRCRAPESVLITLLFL